MRPICGAMRRVMLVGLSVVCGYITETEPALATVCGYNWSPCTATTSSCNLGLWPGGLIYYQWASGDDNTDYNQVARQAMTDWENASSHVIQFIKNDTATPRMTIDARGGGARFGYNSAFNWSNAYHELGHVIGLMHEIQRADREHYVIVYDHHHTDANDLSKIGTTDCSDGNNPRCEFDSAVGGIFGPYDYQSTMQYGVTHPDFTRWDNTPIVPGTQCNELPGNYQVLPPQCLNDDCTGSNCVSPADSSGYTVCPTCAACGHKYPGGMPTKQDGSAVVELYQSPSWGVFMPTVNDDYGTQPFDNTLAPGVTIAANSNPAVETWETNSLTMYVLGSDQHIYERWRTDGTLHSWQGWSNWSDRGCCFSSSPSVVSWGSGRTDLVARGFDNAIYIRTYANGGWGNWQSLGGNSASSPSITSWGPNRLDIFTRTTSDGLQVKSCTGSCNAASGTWSSWQSAPFAGGTFRGRPAVVSRDTGYNDIFVQGTDGKLWANWYHSSGAGYWYPVNSAAGTMGWNSSCPECYSPAAASRGTSNIDVFIRGQDDKAWIISWNGGSSWSGYSALGGVLASSPATVSRVRSTNRIDLVVLQKQETDTGVWTPSTWWKQYPPAP